MRAAIEVLDEGGTGALTFRVLAARLSTGPGAIYHHVASKGDLLAAAASEVMTATLDLAGSEQPRQGVQVVMLAAFDAVRAHPWLGTQLAVAPWQPAVLELFEGVGSRLEGLHVPEPVRFDAASVLVQHLLGFASQVDAVTHLSQTRPDRPALLEQAVTNLMQHGGEERYPFVARSARQLVDHDDREQYEAGVNMILAGIRTL